MSRMKSPFLLGILFEMKASWRFYEEEIRLDNNYIFSLQ